MSSSGANKGFKAGFRVKSTAKNVGECAWTAAICAQMESVGAIWHPLVASGAQSSLPDRLIVSKDWSGLLEFKGLNTVLRLNQSLTIRNMVVRDANFVFIVRYPDLIQLPCAQIVNEDGYYTVARFDGTGKGLLEVLKRLREESETGGYPAV